MRAKDFVSIDIPLVLRDAIARHRLHPRMALHEVIEETLQWWEASGAWTPATRAPVD
jgi:hypothetical protein